MNILQYSSLTHSPPWLQDPENLNNQHTQLLSVTLQLKEWKRKVNNGHTKHTRAHFLSRLNVSALSNDELVESNFFACLTVQRQGTFALSQRVNISLSDGVAWKLTAESDKVWISISPTRVDNYSCAPLSSFSQTAFVCSAHVSVWKRVRECDGMMYYCSHAVHVGKTFRRQCKGNVNVSLLNLTHTHTHTPTQWRNKEEKILISRLSLIHT